MVHKLEKNVYLCGPFVRTRRDTHGRGRLFINILTSDCIAKTISIMEQKNFAANENFDWNAFENDLNLYGGQSKEAITEAYGNTMSNVAVGEVVEGTVTEINKREVTVNIGYKSEGLIAATEFRYNPELTVGEKVDLFLNF